VILFGVIAGNTQSFAPAGLHLRHLRQRRSAARASSDDRIVCAPSARWLLFRTCWMHCAFRTHSWSWDRKPFQWFQASLAKTKASSI